MEVRQGVIAAVIDHARREAPLECCGLLVGDANVIEEAVPTRNELASAARYRVAAADHFTLIRRLRGSERRIVGAYHSHPASPAQPSATDVAEAHYPEFVWMIVSLATAGEPDVKLFRIENGEWREITPRHHP